MATRKWGTETLVNTTVTGSQNQSSVTALADGGFAIAWRDAGPTENLVRWQRFDARGVKLGVENTTGTFGGGNQSEPSITSLANGNIWIAQSDFDSETGLFHSVIGEVFTPTGASVEYRDGAYGAAAGVGYGLSSVAALGNQGSAIAFTRTEYDVNGAVADLDVVIRAFDGTGTQSLATTIINLDSELFFPFTPKPQVVANFSGTIFAVTYEERIHQVVTKTFNDVGTLLYSFQTDEETSAELDPSHAWLDNTRIVTVWTDNSFRDGSGSSISFNILDYRGVVITPETLVNTTTSGDQSNAVVTAFRDGSFVVAWVDASFTGPDNSGTSIYAQAFDTFGQKLGRETLVNTATQGNQLDIALTTLSDGRVVVTWTDSSSTGGDTSGESIRSQIIDVRDGRILGTDNAATPDLLYGNDIVNDEMLGFGGNDTIYGLAGADAIYGADGDDQIYGGRGDDTVYGGNNNDRIYGDLGDDEQYGEIGSDIIYSGAGSDLMDGGAGSDTAYYSSEKIGAIINLADQSQNAGSALGDTLLNFELIFGSNTGADTITGSGATETILGNGGADIFNGGGGADTLRGGVGVDMLNGGTGADKFQYTALNEVGDVITNYEAVDDFQFTRAAFGNLAGANVAAVNFLSVASGHAAVTVNQLFIFDQALDQLWYDADGSTATIAAVMVADLSNNINITNLDLLLF